VTSAGVVTTLAGTAGVTGTADGTGAAARFNSPYSVATDAAGNVYVSDTNNSTLRKVTSAGVVTTFAGAPEGADGTGAAAKLTNPYGAAVDSSGNIYVADSTNHTLRKVTSAGVVTTLAGTAGLFGSADGTGAAARFKAPSAVAVDGSGNVYVADTNNNTIRTVTSAGVVTTLAGTAGVNGSANGTGPSANFFFPDGVAVDGSGNIYVADSTNHTLRKVTSAGVVTNFAGAPDGADGTGGGARFNYPAGVAVDSSGNVFVADYFDYTLRKVTSAGVVTTLAGTAGVMGVTDGTGAAARFNSPAGMSADGSGNVYVADNGNNSIRKVTALGVVTTVVGTGTNMTMLGPLPAMISTPADIAFGGGGLLFMSLPRRILKCPAP
jgi:sugar lactone lactonase YvrE